jgi:hypothetical protein
MVVHNGALPPLEAVGELHAPARVSVPCLRADIQLSEGLIEKPARPPSTAGRGGRGAWMMYAKQSMICCTMVAVLILAGLVAAQPRRANCGYPNSYICHECQP